MPNYSVSNALGGTPQNLTTTYKTQLSVTSGASGVNVRRGWMYEFEIGAIQAPNSTDCAIQWDVSVQTAAGTATALTPQLTDIGSGDYAAQLTYSGNATAEPTVTANSSVFNVGLNQRASQRWLARDDASAIIIPAVASKGVACRALSSNYTGTVSWNAFVRE